MKRTLCHVVLICMLLAGGFSACADTSEALPDTLIESYYLDAEDLVAKYLRNNAFQGFWRMWAAEYFTDEAVEVTWHYDTLSPVQYVDHNFESVVRDGTPLFNCTFSTEDGCYGYIIVAYHEKDPSISQWSLQETTPYQYDLRVNQDAIAAALQATDIDLSTAIATRVAWIDTEKKHGDQIILFQDGKGDRYICYLGDSDFTLEKQ